MPQDLFYKSLLEQTGLALDDVRTRYFRTDEDVFNAITHVLSAGRLVQIEKNTLQRMQEQDSPRLFYRGGIHYRPVDGGWLPLGFLDVKRLNKSPKWTAFTKFVETDGHEQHFSFAAFGLSSPTKIGIEIGQAQIDLIKRINDDCGEVGYQRHDKVRKVLRGYKREALALLTSESLQIQTSSDGLGGPWIADTEARIKWAAWVEADPALKLFTSLYFTIRANPFGDSPQRAIFLNWPTIGGYAFVGAQIEKNPDLWEVIHAVFERILVTIALLHRKLRSEERNPPRNRKVEEAVCNAIKGALRRYLLSLQKPKGKLQKVLHLDKCEPFRYVWRIGHKKSVVQRNRKRLLLTRLAAKSAIAVNFLYADNGTMLNRIQGFLDGVLTQLRVANMTKAEEAILDVYVAPNVSDIRTRSLTLYNHERIAVQDNSIYAKWYKRIFEPTKNERLKMPCVVYRYSETVGPSIFISEVAAVIAKHIIEKHPPPSRLPVRVLNLFSGTGSAELTLWRAFAKSGKDPAASVSVLSLDLNPISLLSRNSPVEERDVARRAMRVSHSIPTDIFALLANDPRRAENVYLREYDIIMADPPHYLVMDFLFQTYPKTGEYLFKRLANDTSGVFILYFGHEEVEWTNVYIHWHLQNMGWPLIWNVLLGEERLILCFGKAACVSRQDCRNDLLKRLKTVATYYYGDEGRVEVHDTFMRKLKEEA